MHMYTYSIDSTVNWLPCRLKRVSAEMFASSGGKNPEYEESNTTYSGQRLRITCKAVEPLLIHVHVETSLCDDQLSLNLRLPGLFPRSCKTSHH